MGRVHRAPIAQPWFRIFNPTAQGERFDPDGDVRASLGAGAGASSGPVDPPALGSTRGRDTRTGCELGRTYPERVVLHEERRAARPRHVRCDP